VQAAGTYRDVLIDADIDGHQYKKGERIFVSIVKANLDVCSSLLNIIFSPLMSRW
jgi:hypothetical protein